MDDPTHVITIRDKHPAGVKHVSYHPSGILFATSGCDGVVRFFTVPVSSSSSVAELHSIENVIPRLEGNRVYESSKVAWHPGGRSFAIPTVENSITLYLREDWKEFDNFKIDREAIDSARRGGEKNNAIDEDDDVKAQKKSLAISDLSWSPNGKYLAATTSDGYIIIWEASAKQIIQVKKVKEKIVAMSWNPKADQIAITTDQGEFQIFNGVISDSGAKSIPHEGMFHLADPVEKIPEPTSTRVKTNGHLNGHKTNGVDGPITEAPADDDLFGSDDDDFIEDDDGTYREERAKEMAANAHKRKYDSTEPDILPGQEINKRVAMDPKSIVSASLKEISKVQYRPFQPGSSKWKMDRRYLTMNLIGYVWTLQEQSYNTVSVSFFDHGTNREYFFKETERFDLASLSKTGTLLAWSGEGHRPKSSSANYRGSNSLLKVHGTTDFDDEENSQSPCLYFKPHTGSSEASWEYRINRDVHGTISAIALSDTLAQVYTSEGSVFTFTAEGYLMRIINVRQPVITAACWENTFFVVRDSGIDALGRTNLVYSIENAQTCEILQKDEPLDVAPGSRLTMAFLSERGDPFIFDSKGNLKVLVSWRVMRQANWTPVFHPKHNKDLAVSADSKLWPLGVTDDDKFIAYRLTKYQKEIDIPLPSSFEELDLEVPVNTDSDPHISKYLLQSIEYELMRDREEIEDDIKEARMEMDKSLLRRFHEGCRSGKSQKALLGLVRWIHFKNSLDTASTIAVKSDLLALAKSINELQDKNENYF